MPSSMGSLGSVFVDVGADLSNLSKQMAAAVPQAAQQGQAVGKAFSQGASANLSFDQFRAKLNGMAAEAAKSGQQAGAAMGSGIASGLNQHASNIADSLRGISGAAIGAGTALSVGVTAPIVALGVASVAAFGQMDSLMRGLTSIAGSAEGAQRQFEELREVAKLPGLGLEEAVQGSIRLQAFGFSAAEAKISMLAFGNAIATVGGGKAELDRVIIQLGQMAGAGKVLTQDLRPIIQTVPQVASIIREQFGPEALGHPAETFEALGVSSKEAIAIIVAELGKLPQVTGGIKNDLENFGDAAKIALSGIGEAIAPLVHGFVTVLVPAMNEAVAVFKMMPAPLQFAVMGIAGLAAAVGPLLLAFGGMARGATEIITLLNTWSIASKAAALAQGELTIATGAQAIASKSLAGGIGLVSGAGIALTGMFALWIATSKDLGGVLNGVADSAEELAKKTDSGGVSAGMLADALKVVEQRARQAKGAVDELTESFIHFDRRGQGGAVEAIRQAEVLGRIAAEAKALGVEVSITGLNFEQAKKKIYEALEAAGKVPAGMAAMTGAAKVTGGAILDFSAITGKAAQSTVQLKTSHESLHPAIHVTRDRYVQLAESLTMVAIPAFDLMQGKLLETRSIFQMIAGETEGSIKNLTANMTSSMEHGVRVIRGNTQAVEENGKMVIKAKEAHQSLGDTVAQTGTIFLGASASIKGMTRDALAVSNAWEDLTDTTVKAGSAIAQTMDQVAVNTAWDTGGAHIVDWTSKFAELGEAARQAAGEAALLATSIKNSMDMASGFKASGGFKASDFSSGDPKYGTSGPAGSGGSGTMAPGGETYVPGTQAGQIKYISGVGGAPMPMGGTTSFNSIELHLWTDEEIKQNEDYLKALQALTSAGLKPTTAEVLKLQHQMFETGQTMEEVIAQWVEIGKAAKEAANKTETLKTATKEAAPNVSDLNDQLWRLIDAGQGNTMAAWDLRSQIENLTGSYQAQGVAATASAGAARAAAGAIFNAANLISESVKTVERQTQAARASLGSDLPYVTNPTMASVTSGTMASRASLNQPAAPYYGPTSSAPTPYIPTGPYQPTFDNQPYGPGLGAAPVTIVIPPGSATAIGQSVTQELRNLAGYV